MHACQQINKEYKKNKKPIIALNWIFIILEHISFYLSQKPKFLETLQKKKKIITSMLNGIDKIFLIICEIYINKTKIKKN